VRRQNEYQPHAKGSRRTSMHGQIKANWKALLRARGAWLGGVPNAWRSWWRPCGQAQRELPVLRPLEGNRGALEVHQIATLTDVRFRG